MLIGIDLGGTKIAAGLVNEGKIIRRAQVPTDAKRGKAHVITQLRRVIASLQAPRGTPVGIGVPGVADGSTIRYLTNVPCLDGVDLQKALRMKVLVANDARCFALAEQRRGAAKGARNVLGIIIGTGLGCGVIIDGRIHDGAHNFAGEIGFASHPRGGKWEQFLAGPGILKRHKGKARLVSEIWSSKSPAARKTFRDEVEGLADYLHTLSLVLDPGVIVLGGGIVNRELTRATDRALRSRFREQGASPRVVMASLRDPGIIGAAELHASRA